jgi:hypothetical protein
VNLGINTTQYLYLRTNFETMEILLAIAAALLLLGFKPDSKEDSPDKPSDSLDKLLDEKIDKKLAEKFKPPSKDDK